MKIFEITEGVGKIITGVNTTADVKAGETERQAKKFFGGNGKPIHMGVKGATPNQAYNMGLTNESNDPKQLFKTGAKDANKLANLAVDMHSKADAAMANSPVANTQQYKDYQKTNMDNKRAAMKKGMPYGRQDGPKLAVPEDLQTEKLITDPKQPNLKSLDKPSKYEKRKRAMSKDDDIDEGSVTQSDVVRVLNNLSVRKDDNPFSVRFYNGAIGKIRPSTAKKVISFIERIEKDDVKNRVMQYISTINGFKEIAGKAGVKFKENAD